MVVRAEIAHLHTIFSGKSIEIIFHHNNRRGKSFRAHNRTCTHVVHANRFPSSWRYFWLITIPPFSYKSLLVVFFWLLKEGVGLWTVENQDPSSACGGIFHSIFSICIILNVLYFLLRFWIEKKERKKEMFLYQLTWKKISTIRIFDP